MAKYRVETDQGTFEVETEDSPSSPDRVSFDSPSVSGTPTLNPNQESTFGTSMINSTALPIMGGVVGGIAGGPPGAFLGGAGGEAYRQLIARSMNQPVPQTSMGAAKDIGVEGATQGAAEFVGGKLLPMAGRAILKTPVLGSALKSVGSFASKTAGDLFQLLTKIPPKDAKILFKNPKAILPGEWTKAQTAWKKAAEEIGIPVDEISPEMIKILSGDAKNMVFETYGKIVAGESVSAKEAQLAKQALDIAVMPVAKTVRKNPLVNTLTKIRQKFVDRIGEESPNMAVANKQYGIAATGKKFRSFFPRNTTGDPAYFRSSIFPTLIAGAGAARGEPGKGALQGAGLAALTSPLAIGSGLALAGGSRTVLPYFRRVLTASAAELAKKKLQGK